MFSTPGETPQVPNNENWSTRVSKLERTSVLASVLRDGSFWDFGFALPGSVAAPNSQLLRQRHFLCRKGRRGVFAADGCGCGYIRCVCLGTSLCSLPIVNPYAPYRHAS